MGKLPRVILTTDASGAQKAAREGMLVMIVDIIDMSTTLESAIDAGAFAVFGASPDFTRAPVEVAPEKVGQEAGRMAKENELKIILIAEPRVGNDAERLDRCRKVIKGIESQKAVIERVLPNIGAEVYKLCDFKDRIAVAVSDTGGVAFDAAFLYARKVLTGTVARSMAKKGIEPALCAVDRVLGSFQESDNGIAIVAASKNSQEDVLAARFIYELLTDRVKESK